MLLSEARTNVRNLVDDIASVRWQDSVVDQALGIAQVDALQLAVGSGSNLFMLQATLTTTVDGLLDLSALKPLKIYAVRQVQGAMRWPVRPSRVKDSTEIKQGVAETLEITYVPRAAFPVAAGSPFVWGSAAVVLPQLDALMVGMAASQLKILEGETNEGLERYVLQRRESVLSLIDVPSMGVMPISASTGGYGRGDGRGDYRWMSPTPDSIQLVWS